MKRALTRRKMIQLLGLGFLSLATGGATTAFAGLVKEKAMEKAEDSRVMLGNVRVSIKAFAKRRLQAQEAIAAAFSEAARLEEDISFFKPESLLSQINAAAGERPVLLPPEIMALIKQAMAVTRRTKGAFNLALGPAMKRWGFLDRKHILTEKERRVLLGLCHPDDLVLDEDRQTVFLRKKGMQIDAGGIGKGFIAERMKAVLKASGVHSGMIALSGDLALFGRKPNERPWRIGIRHPQSKNKIIASLDLPECFISTSGDYERFFRKNGQMYHHILDSKSLLPARSCQSVTVISTEGARSDALSTGIFVMGPKRGLDLLNSGQEEGLIIDQLGDISLTPALEAKVRFHEPL